MCRSTCHASKLASGRTNKQSRPDRSVSFLSDAICLSSCDSMVAYQVNSVVNSARYNGPECIARIGADGT